MENKLRPLFSFVGLVFFPLFFFCLIQSPKSPCRWEVHAPAALQQGFPLAWTAVISQGNNAHIIYNTGISARRVLGFFGKKAQLELFVMYTALSDSLLSLCDPL